MAGQTFFGGSLPPGRLHIGRRWGGPDSVSFECDCPKTACGLTVWGEWEKDCAFHGPMKTIRQSHHENDCPGAE